MPENDQSYVASKISKATKMVVLGDKILIENTKAVCDYHYDKLVEGGVKMYAHTTIFSDAPSIECDYCKEGK